MADQSNDNLSPTDWSIPFSIETDEQTMLSQILLLLVETRSAQAVMTEQIARLRSAVEGVDEDRIQREIKEGFRDALQKKIETIKTNLES